MAQRLCKHPKGRVHVDDSPGLGHMMRSYPMEQPEELHTSPAPNCPVPIRERSRVNIRPVPRSNMTKLSE